MKYMFYSTCDCVTSDEPHSSAVQRLSERTRTVTNTASSNNEAAALRCLLYLHQQTKRLPPATPAAEHMMDSGPRSPVTGIVHNNRRRYASSPQDSQDLLPRSSAVTPKSEACMRMWILRTLEVLQARKQASKQASGLRAWLPANRNAFQASVGRVCSSLLYQD
jgi:hypothetical protein